MGLLLGRLWLWGASTPPRERKGPGAVGHSALTPRKGLTSADFLSLALQPLAGLSDDYGPVSVPNPITSTTASLRSQDPSPASGTLRCLEGQTGLELMTREPPPAGMPPEQPWG